jgi:hypothetical protein
MKLNIGCGLNYLKGHINIDSGHDSLADKFMQAHRLDCEDGSAEEIVAAQLVEHLGFFRTRYFLAECYRVLEPGGILTLETPHIEKTFEVFLGGDRQVREAALGWVYGSEAKGMAHRYCFPAKLLEELISGAGFEVVSREFFEYQASRPALKLLARKRSGPEADFEAALRRALVLRKAAFFGDEYLAAEQEKLITVCRRRAASVNHEESLELAMYQPELAEVFFSVKSARDIKAGPFVKAAETLRGAGFAAIMYASLKKEPLEAEQKAAFEAALEYGRSVIKKLSAGAIGPRSLRKAAGGTPAIFSFEMARIHSAKLFCAGIKAYETGGFADADELFKEALAFSRDNRQARKRLLRCADSSS